MVTATIDPNLLGHMLPGTQGWRVILAGEGTVTADQDV